MTYIAHYDSPLGGITLASDGIALTGLWFDGQKHFAATHASESMQSPDLPIFEQTRHWLDLYFAGHCPDFTPPLAPQGTPSQQKVWELLLAIPYGKTTTYGEIAQRVVETCHGASLQGVTSQDALLRDASSHDEVLQGASLQDVSMQDTSLQETSLQGTSQPKKRMSAQAIGGAVGRNPIAIIIPCHRVIGSNGSLTGYAGGLERKNYLLALEQGKTNYLKSQTSLETDITATGHRIIRKVSLPADAERVMEVFAAGKAIMVKSGNLNQWINGYPSLEVVRSDMEKEGGFVVEDNGQIVAYFAFLPSPEPTYSKIYKGEWLNDTQPYHVIHRIASFPEVHGIFQSIMEFCFERERNIRIDTHRDNHIMQHNILKHGFQYCGIILLANGDERVAYQKMI
ncbi:MAG: methylated-DNA--[protein]-cysteine S-methyltransferase [Bacteroidales bacterium]|nr:methylated-DNA--[protein]-cysteine S-methyltransferase [Bacteroidales bacterium]